MIADQLQRLEDVNTASPEVTVCNSLMNINRCPVVVIMTK